MEAEGKSAEEDEDEDMEESSEYEMVEEEGEEEMEEMAEEDEVTSKTIENRREEARRSMPPPTAPSNSLKVRERRKELEDLDDQEETPDIRRTGPFLYLRLRRTSYDDAALDAWAARIAPFLDDSMDAYVLFRHDEEGTSALHAEGFAARVGRYRAGG